MENKETTNSNYLNVNIRKLSPTAIVPEYATVGSAGLDLTAVRIGIERGEDGVPVLVYDTQLSIEIPAGYVGLLFMRSSVAKKSLTMANAVGVIDSDYRGPVLAKFKVTTNSTPSIYEEGERVVQLVIVEIPKIKFNIVEDATVTERGEGGFGSTDESAKVEANDAELNEQAGDESVNEAESLS